MRRLLLGELTKKGQGKVGNIFVLNPCVKGMLCLVCLERLVC